MSFEQASPTFIALLMASKVLKHTNLLCWTWKSSTVAIPAGVGGGTLLQSVTTKQGENPPETQNGDKTRRIKATKQFCEVVETPCSCKTSHGDGKAQGGRERCRLRSGSEGKGDAEKPFAPAAAATGLRLLRAGAGHSRGESAPSARGGHRALGWAAVQPGARRCSSRGADCRCTPAASALKRGSP